MIELQLYVFASAYHWQGREYNGGCGPVMVWLRFILQTGLLWAVCCVTVKEICVILYRMHVYAQLLSTAVPVSLALNSYCLQLLCFTWISFGQHGRKHCSSCKEEVRY